MREFRFNFVPDPAGGGPWRRPALHRVLPFAVYLMFLLLTDALRRLGASSHALLLVYPLKIASVVAVLYAFRHSYAELSWRQIPRAAEQLTAMCAGLFVFVAWVRFDAHWMVNGATSGYDLAAAGDVYWSLLLVRLAGATLVVPLMEELFWRSFLLRRLVHTNFLCVKPAAVRGFAFVATTLLFALEHNEWFAGLIAGAIFNLLYIRSGTLWSPLIAHAAANALLGFWILATENWKYW